MRLNKAFAKNMGFCSTKAGIGCIYMWLCLSPMVGGGLAEAANKKPVKQTVKAKENQKRLKINPVNETDGAWIANMETNIYRTGTFENITVGYSAHNGWDVSLSLINVQVLGEHNRFQGEPFLNLAKTFQITARYSIDVGSLNGASVSASPYSWLNFTFVDNDYDFLPWLTVHGGGYFANAAVTGNVRHFGFLAGAEITLVPQRLEVHMDYISGHHAFSGAAVNALFNLTPKAQIYLGVLVPEQGSGNEFAGVVGINFSDQPF